MNVPKGGRSSLVAADVDGGVRRIELRRGRKRNALSRRLVEGLAGALREAACDPESRVVAICGEGSDFSAGADLVELAESRELSREERLEDAMRLGELFKQIRNHPRPVVATVRGRALGGGCGLAIACDAVLASDDARFGFPELHIGFVPALVMAMLRRKLPETRIFDLVATGKPVSAARAAEIGLITKVFPGESFDSGAAEYLRDLAGRPPGAMNATRKLLAESDGLSFDDAMALGAHVNAEARESDELRDGLARFFRRR